MKRTVWICGHTAGGIRVDQIGGVRFDKSGL